MTSRTPATRLLAALDGDTSEVITIDELRHLAMSYEECRQAIGRLLEIAEAKSIIRLADLSAARVIHARASTPIELPPAAAEPPELARLEFHVSESEDTVLVVKGWPLGAPAIYGGQLYLCREWTKSPTGSQHTITARMELANAYDAELEVASVRVFTADDLENFLGNERQFRTTMLETISDLVREEAPELEGKSALPELMKQLASIEADGQLEAPSASGCPHLWVDQKGEQLFECLCGRKFESRAEVETARESFKLGRE